MTTLNTSLICRCCENGPSPGLSCGPCIYGTCGHENNFSAQQEKRQPKAKKAHKTITSNKSHNHATDRKRRKRNRADAP